MGIDSELLTILVCPSCKGKVSSTKDETGLFCPACCLTYPIRDGIPIMLPDAAVKEASQ